MAATYEVELVDEFSSPAKSIVSAMREMKSLAQSMRGAISSAGGALDKTGSQAGKASGFMGQLKGSLFGSMTAANLATGAIRKVAGALFNMAKAGVMAVGKAILFRESLKFSLTRFLGDAGKADVAMGRISDVAGEIGVSFQEAGSDFKNFVSAGFTEDAAIELIKFKKDILALGDGTDRTSQRVTEAFIQIEKAMATGKIEADGFTSILANLPVTQLQVMEKLAPKIGKNVGDLVDQYGKLKVEITKLPVKELLESFQEATLAATGFGAAGEAAVAKAFTTLPGALDFLTAKVGNIPDQIAAKVGDGAKNSVLPVMQQLSAALDSDKAAQGIQVVADVIVGLLESIADFAALAGEFFSSFSDGFASVNDVLGPLGDSLNGAGDAAGASGDTMKLMGEVFGAVAGVVVFLYDALSFLVDILMVSVSPIMWVINGFKLFAEVIPAIGSALSLLGEAISDAVSWMMDGISSFLGAAYDLGSNIMGAIADGIVASAVAVVDAIRGAVGSAIDAAKSLLGIESPSKVFMNIGDMTGKGLLLGLDINAKAANDAFADLVRPPPAVANSNGVSGLSAPSIDPSRLASGAGSPGGGNVIHITVDTQGAFAAAQASPDPVAFQAAVKHMITDELADELEERLIMLGQVS